MIKALKERIARAVVRKKVTERLDNKNVMLLTNEMLESNKFRGYHIGGKPILFEKESLFQIDTKFLSIINNVYGNTREIGFTSGLLNLAIESDCIIVFDKIGMAQMFAHHMKAQAFSMALRTNIFKLLFVLWTVKR